MAPPSAGRALAAAARSKLRLVAASVPPPGRGSGVLAASPGVLPGSVQFALGPLGPCPELRAGFLEDLGAGLQRGAQLVALAGSVGADLRGLGPGALGALIGLRSCLLAPARLTLRLAPLPPAGGHARLRLRPCTVP